MSMPRVAVLGGDGIGPEVTASAVAVLGAAGLEAEWIEADIGWRCWCEEGEALPERTLTLLRGCDAALMGAITSKPAAAAEAELSAQLRGRGLSYASPIVRLRRVFDLYANVRPARTLAGTPGFVREGVDVVIFRENTEDLYTGIEHRPIPPGLWSAMRGAERCAIDPSRSAVSHRIISEAGVERIARAAFEYARLHGRRRVTLLEKPNVLRATGGLFLDVADRVSLGYPDVEFEMDNVDSACMHLVRTPARYDVILAANLFGDIVSDLAAGLTGGLGLAASANLGGSFSLFEPVHGSAPDIAGLGIANPMAAVRAAGMLASHLGQVAVGDAIEAAVASLIAEGGQRAELLTPDLAGCGSTRSVTDELCRRVMRA